MSTQENRPSLRNKRRCLALNKTDWHRCKNGRGPWRPFCPNKHLRIKYLVGYLGTATITAVFGITTTLGALAEMQSAGWLFKKEVAVASDSNARLGSPADIKDDSISQNNPQIESNNEAADSNRPLSEQQQGESKDKGIVLRTQEIQRDKNEAISRPKQPTRRVTSNQADILRALNEPSPKEEVLKELNRPTAKEEVIKILNPSLAASNQN